MRGAKSLIRLRVCRSPFSREERRPHVHVQHSTGEAKVWLEPRVELALNYGLSPARITTALRIVREHEDEVRAAWQRHFG